MYKIKIDNMSVKKIKSCYKCGTELTQSEIRYVVEMDRDLFPWNLFCSTCEEYEEKHSPSRQRHRTRIELENERKFLGMSVWGWVFLFIWILYPLYKFIQYISFGRY